MRLMQSGPEMDAFGELLTKVLSQSSDVLTLREEGRRIADQCGAHDQLWIHGITRSERQYMQVRDDIFLAIES